jgi:hypothetical protein
MHLSSASWIEHLSGKIGLDYYSDYPAALPRSAHRNLTGFFGYILPLIVKSITPVTPGTFANSRRALLR